MNQELYELIALVFRYIFAGLMALIVIRAWRITIIDSRKAKTLRRISPETGISGELMVLEGDERARRGMKYPVIREGQIGSGRRADIRVRHSSVRRRHAYFQLTREGLKIRSHAGAPLRDACGKPVKEIILRDGDEIAIGRILLLLVLTEAPVPERNIPNIRRNRRIREDEDYYDDAFDDDPDDLFSPDPARMFRESPVLRHVSDAPEIDPLRVNSHSVRPSGGYRHLPFDTIDPLPSGRPSVKRPSRESIFMDEDENWWPDEDK